jgi:hypothetical protein
MDMDKNIISINSNKLIVANHFLDKENEYKFEVPLDEVYSDKYCLNHYKGQYNMQTYVSKTHNVGKVRTGNCGVWVYKHKNGDVYFTHWGEVYDFYTYTMDEKGYCERSDFYLHGEEKYFMFSSDEEMNYFLSVAKDFTYQFKISCRVWRIEFCDYDLLNDDNTIIYHNMDYGCSTENVDEIDHIDMENGEYEIIDNNFHDLPSREIFAILRKVEK